MGKYSTHGVGIGSEQVEAKLCGISSGHCFSRVDRKVASFGIQGPVLGKLAPDLLMNDSASRPS